MRDIKKEILSFWFIESKPQQWFQINDTFDQQVDLMFRPAYQMAVNGLCDSWMADAEGCVALCLTLCHIPRHIFRSTPKAYATDKQGLLVAKHALAKTYDQLVPVEQRYFLYSPFMYSENFSEQKRSVELFSKIKDKEPVHYKNACERRDVIKEFGRFPSRNAILERISTKEESFYLDNGPLKASA